MSIQLFFGNILQVTDAIQEQPEGIPVLESIFLKAGLIILLLALASGIRNYTKVEEAKKKAFFKGFTTVLVVAFVIVLMFSILAYLVTLQTGWFIFLILDNK